MSRWLCLRLVSTVNFVACHFLQCSGVQQPRHTHAYTDFFACHSGCAQDSLPQWTWLYVTLVVLTTRLKHGRPGMSLLTVGSGVH